MKYLKIALLITAVGVSSSCNKYLDIVPDDIATIDHAFRSRASAEKFLFTCYSYMPRSGDFNANPAYTAGDEIWYMNPPVDVSTNFYSIALGAQNAASPYGNFWSGGRGGTNLFIAIRDCNIFIENIGKVKEVPDYEKERWIAEVKFLKAYYHFYLFRIYGPIPLIKENLPITSTTDELKVFREPVDDVVDYIKQLLNEAAASENLPDVIGDQTTEAGRITRPVVLGLKARLMVTAASPLFNGNADYAGLKDSKGRQLFNPSYDAAKWDSAATACSEAIELVESLGYRLHEFTAPANANYKLVPETKLQLDIRTALTEKWNSEIIWANTQSIAGNLQRWAMPLLKNVKRHANNPKGILAPPLKIAEMFYTKNGLPISQDNSFDYAERYSVKEASAAEMNDPMLERYNKYYIKDGYPTAVLNFDREPRFYADLGFDGGLWFGNSPELPQTNYDSDNMEYVQMKAGMPAARQGISNFSITGYVPKKVVDFTSSTAADGQFTMRTYPWPEMRLADLYLLYAEALNEKSGYDGETVKWINFVRQRAGIPSVEASWDSPYSKQPGKYLTKNGLREIIHRERLIELAFEGQRYWDLKRWKEAHDELNESIKGWDISQQGAAYYKPTVLYNQTFGLRDYFWPIPQSEVIVNKNLVQNPGW